MNTFFKKVILKIAIEYRFLKKRFNKRIVTEEQINKLYIKRYLPESPIIIDAGAHVGGDSIEMCRLYSGAKVYAFEPVPAIFQTLKHNTRKFKNIICTCLALSDQNGKQILHLSSGASDGSSSFLKPKEHLKDHPDVFFDHDIEVQTQTLDDWAEQAGVKKIDLLWLDMQGFELEVLKASKNILPTVKVIHMEVSTRQSYENAPLYPVVKEWLASKGFRVDVEAIPKGWDMGNVLFVNEKN